MKERPILFSGPMVRAILNGTKTQTRRIVKPQPVHIDGLGTVMNPSVITGNSCKHGKPGDTLWVRETWAHRALRVSGPEGYGCPVFRADDVDRRLPSGPYNRVDRWRPSIHMPRWASRITLQITAVRVERLQDISEEDAIAEGVEFGAKESYRTLWDSINGAGAWDANPWVWVIEFKRVKA